MLRDVLGMTGTKFGCGMALCGACTVHIDGVATCSRVTPVDSVGGSQITTIEAIGATPAGAKIQKASLDLEVVQCGYCQLGQIMSASALLASKPHPTDSDIDDAMSGNICRCGTYVRIREAIKRAAQSIRRRSTRVSTLTRPTARSISFMRCRTCVLSTCGSSPGIRQPSGAASGRRTTSS